MKKTIFILALLCLQFSLRAQVDSSYRGRMDYLLQGLNPALVTTGILYDRVEPWADLRNFGHRGYADTSNLIHYWQTRFELVVLIMAQTQPTALHLGDWCSKMRLY